MELRVTSYRLLNVVPFVIDIIYVFKNLHNGRSILMKVI